MTDNGEKSFPGAGALAITQPPWMEDFLSASPRIAASDEERMHLVIGLARLNVMRDTGGPFGAAVFEDGSGLLVSAGVNSVERLGNSVVHAEVMALMFAQAAARSFTLNAPGMRTHVLVTSCDPCAMCLGAALWSGVQRVVCGAPREAAMDIGFEEGPVFPESYSYLEERGIRIVRGVLAGEAQEVLRLYKERGGAIYNG